MNIPFGNSITTRYAQATQSTQKTCVTKKRGAICVVVVVVMVMVMVCGGVRVLLCVGVHACMRERGRER